MRAGVPPGYEARRLAWPDGEVAALARPGRGGAGRGGTLVVAHANGLNAGAYAPFLAALDTGLSVLAPDLRGHGRTRLPTGPPLRDWHPYARDLAEVARRTEGPVTLLGHSLGAVSSLLAAAAGTEVRRLLMIEPVVVPRLGRLVARTPLRRPLLERRGIAARAAGRRASWPDRAAVREGYARNPFFAAWDEAALEGYLARGLIGEGAGDAAGEGPVRLACDPAWEATSFAAQGHRFWGPLREVAAHGVPVHVLRAEGRTTVPGRSLRRLEAAGARLASAPGGHLLPQERPAAAAAWASGVLAGV